MSSIGRVLAPNPSALTLEGTNTYVVQGWVIDPGPDDRGHLESVLAEAGGGIDAIALTHSHSDHAAGAQTLSRLAGDVPIHRPGGEGSLGPFSVIATPGHAPDHVTFLYGRTAFVGDTVLGRGSVFIHPDEGSLIDYLASLRRLLELDLELICPGHGPCIDDPDAKLREYLDHRHRRERALLAALDHGARTEDELLDRAWADVGPDLRPAAALTLRAHLAKLSEQGRLPSGLAPGLVDWSAP